MAWSTSQRAAAPAGKSWRAPPSGNSGCLARSSPFPAPSWGRRRDDRPTGASDRAGRRPSGPGATRSRSGPKSSAWAGGERGKKGSGRAISRHRHRAWLRGVRFDVIEVESRPPSFLKVLLTGTPRHKSLAENPSCINPFLQDFDDKPTASLWIYQGERILPQPTAQCL